jgi:hypothetical protein
VVAVSPLIGSETACGSATEPALSTALSEPKAVVVPYSDVDREIRLLSARVPASSADVLGPTQGPRS